MSPEDQLQLLRTGCDRIISEEDLLAKLKLGRPLRVKLGVDPTSPDIHLGHTVPLWKLRQFQDLGHHAVLIIGNFTARIGDPTGRKSTRPQLDEESIQRNARTYEEQAFKILKREQTEIVWNDDWFGKMQFGEVMRLLARKSVAQMLVRDDFKKRYDAGEPIQLHELTYPMLQGWDSVVVRSDVELGGTDQLFNLLVGRDLQAQENLPQQVAITMPLLEGTDGVEKMSKSLGNYIGVTEAPFEMFGKTMSVSDELMQRWYEVLFADKPGAEMHPMEAKKQLAARIVTRFHSAELAVSSRTQWESQFSAGKAPEEMPEYKLVAGETLRDLLKASGLAPSGSEAGRMVKQGAVSLDGEKLPDDKAVLTKPGVLKYGKRSYLRLV